MNAQPRFLLKKLSETGAALGITVLGSLMVHSMVMYCQYYVGMSNATDSFPNLISGTFFSPAAWPMLSAYGIFSLVIFVLWRRTKSALLHAHRQDLEREKNKAAMEAAQRLTGVMAEHITSHNSEILKWVEFRKSQGQMVSPKVESSARKIAHSLRALSEAVFVAPYSRKASGGLAAITGAFRSNLEPVLVPIPISGLQESKPPFRGRR